MTDHGIIFSAPMVRALIAGHKTQTRRLASSPLSRVEPGDRLWVRENCRAEELSRPDQVRKATPKERRLMHRTQVIVADELDGADGVRYMADNAWCIIDNNPEAADAWTRMFLYSQKPGQHPPGAHGKTVPSIHMPRWASRLTLSVTDARLQRLPEITDTDAIAEGLRLAEQQPGYFEVADLIGMDPVAVFATLWDSLHDIPGERWCDAPEVVALTFRVSLCNIDQTKE